MSSWKNVSKWYDSIVSKEGHYYHQHVVIPGTLKLLNLEPSHSLLDLACGQGILARHVPCNYLGIDGAEGLISAAKKHSKHRFQVHDLTQPLELKETFSHAAIILALQNIFPQEQVIATAHKYLNPHGSLVIVMNHPCFRIPRQTHWGVDEVKKLQYRRVDRYLSPMKIPILVNPGQPTSEKTWSYHSSLTDLSRLFLKGGFYIAEIQEWVSDKTSTGSKAKMEDFARKEFPLFLAFRLVKI
ncbi:MAG: class I SAM-dependent methyltransferase [Simkaniaceae bacterium]|nr:class I SAM-dependent methyltransferase [Simkaniaceae bacterium]